MIKKLYALGFLTLLSSAIIAQDNKDKAADNSNNPNAPEISFEQEQHDFGTIEYSGNGVYEFKFTNTGKEPLVITNARGSCGCTVPTWPKEPIKKGETSFIKVSYDTKRPGPFTKTVTLDSNAKSKTKVLTIKGVVLSQEETESQMPVKKTNSMMPLENTGGH